MIHRALFGSIERFFGVLVEHYAGAFPAWLAPVQATVLPVADRHDAYAFRVVDRLKAEGFRAEMVDGVSGALGARIRRAKTEKVPYVLVVGDDDVEHGTVGVNKRGSDDPERDVTVDDVHRAARGRSRRARRELADESRTTVGRLARRTTCPDSRHRSTDHDGCVLCRLVAADRRRERARARAHAATRSR